VLESKLGHTCRARIFKLLWSPGIDSKEPIPPACVAWRARCHNPIPTRFLAPIDCLKIQHSSPPIGKLESIEEKARYITHMNAFVDLLNS
jgi:hypothetical protein